ncbi:complement C1q tumor necrosis factor-related protein 3-like [Chaetodon trifascialis]|uniref:complement C1q tumor necrosis factor-related protein 3-like n=1 Tax=Chaetodon trifascialis TaxID=109706 RepID=UPI0039968AD0
MKTSATLLILCLFHFCFAMVQELDHHAGKDNGSEIHKIEPSCACAGDMTGSQENFCPFAVILGELEAKLRNTEKQLEDLRGEVRGNQVAFGASTGISANFGPFNTGFTLAYKNVYISTGMYTPTTGKLGKSVKGVYYFSLSGRNPSTKPMGLRPMNSGVQIVTVYNHPAEHCYKTSTSGMTLQLEGGDQVYMRLIWIFDHLKKHSTFIGHLLFPL